MCNSVFEEGGGGEKEWRRERITAAQTRLVGIVREERNQTGVERPSSLSVWQYKLGLMLVAEGLKSAFHSRPHAHTKCLCVCVCVYVGGLLRDPPPFYKKKREKGGPEGE